MSFKMKMFLAYHFGSSGSVNEVEVTRSTDKSVWLHDDFFDREMRRARESQHEKFCETYEDAVDFVRKGYESAISAEESQLNYLQNQYNKFLSSLEEGS